MGSEVPHIGHRNHLCSLIVNGLLTLDQMKALIRDTKFICKICGRSAVNQNHLCEPEPFDHVCGACGKTFVNRMDLLNHTCIPLG